MPSLSLWSENVAVDGVNFSDNYYRDLNDHDDHVDDEDNGGDDDDEDDNSDDDGGDNDNNGKKKEYKCNSGKNTRSKQGVSSILNKRRTFLLNDPFSLHYKIQFFFQMLSKLSSISYQTVPSQKCLNFRNTFLLIHV